MKETCNYFGKILILLLCTLAIMGLTAACGKLKEKSGEQNAAATKRTTIAEKADSVAYREKSSIKISGYVAPHIALRGNCFFGTTNATTENGSPSLYYNNMTDEACEEIPAKRLTKDVSTELIACLPDNRAVILLDTKEGAYLYGVEKDGTEFLYQALTAPKAQAEDNYPVKLLAVSDTTLAVVWRSALQIYNINGTLEKETASDNMLVSGAVTKSGGIVCAAPSVDGCVAVSYDMETGKWNGKIPLCANNLYQANDMADGDVYEFYYRGEEGIYGYDLENKTNVLVLSLLDFYLNASASESWLPAGEDRFVITGYGTDYNAFCSIYEKIPADLIKEKTVIRIATFGIDEDLETMMAQFNKASDTYKLEYRDYNDENGLERLLTEIITGKAPDILDLYSLPIDQLIAVNALEDLTPYYENDDKVSLDELLEPVREAMTINGKVYYVADAFSIDSLLARKSDVGDKTGWTLGEFLALQKEKAGTARPTARKDTREIMGLATYATGDFVDWETGTTHYDSEDFKAFLAMCNELGSTIPDTTDSEFKQFRDGKLYLSRILFTGLGDLLPYADLYGDDASFIGYPCADRDGSYFFFYHRFGMNAKSENKEGAWEFLREFVRSGHQSNNRYIGLPTLKASYELLLNTAKLSYNYGIGFCDDDEEFSSIEFHYERITDEQAAFIDRLLYNTHKAYVSDGMLGQIIGEEVTAYFHGNRSLDDTVKIIQNRTQTYVNEQK